MTYISLSVGERFMPEQVRITERPVKPKQPSGSRGKTFKKSFLASNPPVGKKG